MGSKFSAFRVLIVCGDAADANFLARVLEALEVAGVHQAGDGEAGLVLLREQNPDLVFVDLEMPDPGGIELIRHLGEKEDPPALVLTGTGEATLLRSARKLSEAHGLDLLGELQDPYSKNDLAGLLGKYTDILAKKDGPQGAAKPRAPQERLSIDEVRAGIGAGCVFPVFQPKVDIKTGELLGVETLARWRDDEHGVLGPAAFIPVAEEAGLLGELTKVVFQAAMREAAKWKVEGLDIKVSVNAGVSDLEDQGFAAFITKTAAANGIRSDRVIIEITETGLMADIKKPLEVLSKLRRAGCGLSIDDFGTGYSSLQQLQRIPVTELKIDRAFVFEASEDAEKRAILKSSIALGHELNLQVVAEGAETLEDWRLLEQLGCDICQGFFVARPMAADELIPWLETWKQEKPEPAAAPKEPDKDGAARKSSRHRPASGLPFGLTRQFAAVLGLVLLVIGYLAYDRSKTPTPAAVPASSSTADMALPSIAVLPFVNMSGDPEQEYFSDGISEELLNTLSRLPNLKVASRTSSFQFKGKTSDITEIARQLGVSHVLEGSVRKAGNRVRITAQLIKASDGFHLWSETFDRELDDIFAVQDEISAAIVEALRKNLGLTRSVISDPKVARPVNIEAYQAYLRGRYFWNRRSPEALLKAIGYFEQAIEIAPEYAAAYHGLADAHLVLLVAVRDPTSFSARFQLGKAANEKALELDPEFGPAYSTLAFVNLLRFRLDELIPNSEKAVALAPNYPTAHHWMAVQTGFLGYPGKALPVMRRALALDPLSIVINFSYGNALFEAGRHAEAIAQFKETITLAPDFEWAWFSLGMAYLHLGRFDEARGVAGDIEDAGGSGAFGAWIDLIEGKTALEEDGPEIDRLIAESEFRQSRIISLLVLAGFHDRAIDYFEESAALGLNLVFPTSIGGNPTIRPLFSEPRFQKFLRDVGFVDYWRENGWPDGCRALADGDFTCDAP